MCGVGTVMVTVTCDAVAGPTDATITTEVMLSRNHVTNSVQAPCDDVWSNCGTLAENYCYQSQISTGCPNSCGLCAGMEEEEEEEEE